MTYIIMKHLLKLLNRCFPKNRSLISILKNHFIPFSVKPRKVVLYLRVAYSFFYMIISIYFLVSMETLRGDVQQLRKGLDVTKNEREKQPDNYALHVSFS